jgi:hypothetical protein
MKPMVLFLLLATTAQTVMCQSPSPIAGSVIINRIELSKISRGYEEHVRITPDSVNVLVQSSLDPTLNADYGRKITQDEWANLVKTLDAIKLQNVASLPSPTMNRAMDAAKHSTITITTSNEKEYSHGYDDENPHDALKPLLRKIIETSGKKD